jgi:hypothetical protein
MHGSIAVRGAATTHRTHRSWSAIAVSIVAVAAIVAGLALAFLPYSRTLVGSIDGTRALAPAECGVPITEAFDGTGSRALSANEVWLDAPPCQHSARFRAGVGAFLVIAGGWVLISQAARRRRGARND